MIIAVQLKFSRIGRNIVYLFFLILVSSRWYCVSKN